MGNYGRDNGRGGGYRGGGFNRGGGRGGFSSTGRSTFGRGGGRGDREMFDVTCSNCGKAAQVPFRPTNGKPVYCSDCFEKMGNRSDSRRPERSEYRPQAQSGPDLSAINAKLDKILSLLEPKVVEVKSEPKTVKVAEAVDLPKIKKAVKKVASKKSGKAGSGSAGKK